jgi:spermidine synthase
MRIPEMRQQRARTNPHRGAAGIGVVLAAALAAGLSLAPLSTALRAQEAFDQAARLKLLEKPDGLLEHLRSPYNDIYIHKKRDEVTMSFQRDGWHYTESRTNLREPADLPLMYSRAMTAAAIYPEKLQSILMIGLGGGSISMYFAKHIQGLKIDAVDIDPAVIELAKHYFGIRETERVRYYAADGRKFVEDAKEQYDLILLDAYDGGNVPSHLMTRDFYEHVKAKLSPGGAVAANLHDGTKLFASSLATMRAVFGPLELYPSGRGETIAVGVNGAMPDESALKRRAEQRQEQFQFRYSQTWLLKQKSTKLPPAKGDVLMDKPSPPGERKP